MTAFTGPTYTHCDSQWFSGSSSMNRESPARIFATSNNVFTADVSCTEDRIADGRLRLKCDDTRAETRFRLPAKRTSPFKSAGASVQATTGSRGVRISGSNAGYTMFRGSVRILSTYSSHQFPFHFPSRASPCVITFQLDSTVDKDLQIIIPCCILSFGCFSCV